KLISFIRESGDATFLLRDLKTFLFSTGSTKYTEFLQNYGTVSKQNAGRYTALHAGRKNFILMEE
ncbi:hypothetical protein, partial [Parabacteroides johnsonii]|uniref:hypothetical protein n=1 Tax=Parabacteroides johnsonii TaxID=387661 RepID=UPI00266BB084